MVSQNVCDFIAAKNNASNTLSDSDLASQIGDNEHDSHIIANLKQQLADKDAEIAMLRA